MKEKQLSEKIAAFFVVFSVELAAKVKPRVKLGIY